MKLVPVNHSFRTVSQKQVDLSPALANRLGKKRPAVKFDCPEYEQADLPELVEKHGAVLLTCLNESLVTFAKAQFVNDPANWEFVPSAESLSLEALAASFESVSRGRVLTLENAAKLATWIQKNLAAIVIGIQKTEPEYQATQAQAIIGVIAKYTAYEAKGATFAEKIVLRLNQIMEAIVEDDSLVASFMEESVLASIFEALLKKFSKSVEDEISEDAL